MALTKKSQQVWQQVSGILLSDPGWLDALEHVGLLTVIGGVRPVALFLDISDVDTRKLLRPLRMIHLTPFLATGPVSVQTWESPHPPEITRIFREQPADSGLWVCRNPDDVRTIRNGVDQITAGRLLGYPECCVDGQQRDHASFEDALVRAWSREFGDDPDKIAEAWRAERKVRVEFESPERIGRSRLRFPFVQHIACEACLTPGDTPTAVLNSQYRDFVADVDPGLHAYLMRWSERV
jgi:hypothetical protein